MTAPARERQPSRRPRRLAARFAFTSWLATSLSMVLFAAVAFVVVLISELTEPTTLSSGEIGLEAAQDVAIALAIALPVGMLIAVAGSLWLARRTLAPITAVIRGATEMTANHLQRRLPVPREDDELRALVIAQNSLFERLEQGFGAVSRFAANASHEIRTPLATVQSELEIALRRPRSAEEWQAVAERSLEELQHLNRIVSALFEYARVGAPVPGAQRTDVRLVVDRVLAKHAPVAAARGVELALLDGIEGGRANIGSDSLEIVLSNLVSNALRFAPPGGRVVLTIEIGPDGRMSIHVDDDGPGVDATERSRLFTPFERGRAPREPGDAHRHGLGLGLGLAIAKDLVEQHRGTLDFSSSNLGGARFTVGLMVATPSD